MSTATITIKYSEDVEDVFGPEHKTTIELDPDEVANLRKSFEELVQEYSKPEMPFYAFKKDGGIRRVTDPKEQLAYAKAAARKTLQMAAMHGEGVFANLPLPEEMQNAIKRAAGEN